MTCRLWHSDKIPLNTGDGDACRRERRDLLNSDRPLQGILYLGTHQIGLTSRLSPASVQSGELRHCTRTRSIWNNCQISRSAILMRVNLNFELGKKKMSLICPPLSTISWFSSQDYILHAEAVWPTSISHASTCSAQRSQMPRRRRKQTSRLSRPLLIGNSSGTPVGGRVTFEGFLVERLFAY